MHRGRALAAFNQILINRVQQLKPGGGAGASTNRQTNTQSDVQTLLSPLSQSEEDLLLPVRTALFFSETLGQSPEYCLTFVCIWNEK